MISKHILTAFACVALSAPLTAHAGESKAPTGAEIGASKAGASLQKSAGMKDSFTAAELASAVPLKSVDKSSATLEAAKVDDNTGKIIGTIVAVKTDSLGKVSALHVDVGSFLGVGGRVVAVPVSQFSYIPSRNILIANLNKKDIEALPPLALN